VTLGVSLNLCGYSVANVENAGLTSSPVGRFGVGELRFGLEID
jgi:hypothetical protein